MKLLTVKMSLYKHKNKNERKNNNVENTNLIINLPIIITNPNNSFNMHKN